MQLSRNGSIFDVVRQTKERMDYYLLKNIAKINNNRRESLLKLRGRKDKGSKESLSEKKPHSASPTHFKDKRFNKRRPKIRKCDSFKASGSSLVIQRQEFRKLIKVAARLLSSCLNTMLSSKRPSFIFSFMSIEFIQNVSKAEYVRMINVLKRISVRISKRTSSWLSHLVTTPVVQMSHMSKHELEQRLNKLFFRVKLDTSCLVTGLYYLDMLFGIVFKLFERSVETIRVIFDVLFYGSFLLASKYLEDYSIWNFEFIKAFPKFTPSDLIEIERIILSIFEWKVDIPVQEYYFRHTFLKKIAAIN